MLDSDAVHKHANWHQMKLKEYNARFITLVTPQRANRIEKEDEAMQTESQADAEENKARIKEERKEDVEAAADDDKIEVKEIVSTEEISKKNEKAREEIIP